MKPHPIAYIDDVSIINKKVLARVDFNVSLTDGLTISDDARIRQSLPTIQHIIKNHDKLILMSHLDRPKKRDPRYSLGIVARHLQKLISSHKVILVDDFLSKEGKAMLTGQKHNEIMMLENTRFYEGEEKNDRGFSKQLGSLADVFVNDAFGSSHRSHASVVGVARFLPSFGGLLLRKEVEMIEKVVKHPQRPFVAILGGAKVSTKIGVVKKLKAITDSLLIGGGMANTFFRSFGYEIGKSLYERKCVTWAKKLRKDVVLPSDVVVGMIEDEKSAGEVRRVDDAPYNAQILDIGPETESRFGAIIARAKTIVWSGPMGYFENPNFRRGTDFIYYAIAQNQDAFSIVGGGDTIAAISKKEHLERITHISTGGGAMLEFIEKGTLPGIDALRGRGHF